MGYLNPLTGLSALQSALVGSLSTVSIQGLGALGQVLDLPPLLTAGIQIVSSLAIGIGVGGLTGGSEGAWRALANVAPKAFREFASSGVAILGNQLGLPPMVSGFLGVAAGAATGAFTENFIASRAPPQTA